MTKKFFVQLATVLTLSLAVYLFFFRAIFGGQTILPLDTIKEFDLLLGDKGFQAKNFLLTDVSLYFYPNLSFLLDGLADKNLSFWNPYQGGGLPFWSDSQNSFFEITKLLSYLLHISSLDFFLFSAVIQLLLGGLFTFLFFRNRNFSSATSLFGAITFIFSGPVVVWLNYPLTAVFIWLPLILLCLDKIKDKKFLYCPVLMMAVAFQFFAGQIQASVLVFLLAAGYFFVDYIRLQKKFLIIGLCLTSVIVGVMISAVCLGPSLETIFKSQSFYFGRSSKAHQDVAAIASNQFSNPRESFKALIHQAADFALSAVNPRINGSPISRDYKAPGGNMFLNFSETANYCGLITIALAAASAWFLKDRWVRFWLPTAFISFVVAADLPFFNLVTYLPIINKINVGRVRYLFVFSIICLAVYILQRLYDLKIKDRRIIWLVFVLVFLVFADLWFSFSGYHPAISKDTKFLEENRVVKYLQLNLHPGERFIGVGTGNGFSSPLIPDLATYYKIEDVRAYNPILPQRYLDLSTIFLNKRGSFVLSDNQIDERLADLFGVKFLVCPLSGCIIKNKTDDWPVVYQDNKVVVVENKHFLSRAFVVNNYLVVDDAKEAIDALVDSDFNLYSTAVLVSGDKNVYHQDSNITSAASAVNLINLKNDYIKYEVDSSNSGGILVLSNNFDSGWKAFINGSKVNTFPVDLSFIGIDIPAGHSFVEFYYLPPRFYFYFLITIIGFIITISAVFLLIFIKRGKHP